MIKILLICGVTIFFFGCSNQPGIPKDNTYSEKYTGIEKGKKIFIAPVQVNFENLKKGGDIVLDEIGNQLELSGWDVVTTSNRNYEEIWSELTRSIGGIYSPSTGRLNSEKYHYALRKFVKVVNNMEQYSAVLFPSFLLKTAELKGKSAHWDGVKRRKIFIGPYATDMSWSGTTKGLSLKLITFDSEGTWMFTSYGGLVLPFHTIIKNNKPVNEAREDIFEETTNIESGVRVALLPISNKDLTIQASGTQ